MYKKLIQLMMLSVLFSLAFVRCSDDDNPSYEKQTIDNAELLTALQKADLTFEGNLLVIDDKVNELIDLDLSGAGLTSVEGLDIFPKLTKVNLSNNAFGDSFDFSKLPTSVQNVNLQDNEIYEYEGLIEVNFETAEIKVLRNFEQIDLPASARYNMEAIPFYSKESKETKLTMQKANTKMAETYTTLREVPDELIRAYLKNSFSSIMTEDGKIDISKKLSTEQASLSLMLDMTFYYEPVSGPIDVSEAQSIEGIEYIINNPFYKATAVVITPKADVEYLLGYLHPQKSLEMFRAYNTTTPKVNWDDAEHIRAIMLAKNKSIKEIDFSHSKKFLTEGGLMASSGIADYITLYDCPELTTLKFPDTENPILSLWLLDLPKLKDFSLKNITGFGECFLADLPSLKELSFEKIVNTVDYTTGEINTVNGTIFSITEDMLKTKGVKDFIVRFGKEGKFGKSAYTIKLQYRQYGKPYKDREYDYTYLYEEEDTEAVTKSSSKEIQKQKPHVDLMDALKQRILRERNVK